MPEIIILLLVATVLVLGFLILKQARQLNEQRLRLDRIESDIARRTAALWTPAPKESSVPPPLPVSPPPSPLPAPDILPPSPPATAPSSPAQVPPVLEMPGSAIAETPPAPAGQAPVRPPESMPAAGAPARPMHWERFLGVQLFAWVGGLALFLGVAFFVKYAFERNLISAPLRVAIGYLVGGGLIAGGLWLPRRRHLVTVQTLCATGILVLYANTFSAHAYHHVFGTTLTFGLMSMITAAAFVLAVRLEGQVVAVLGVLGGFLTPPLLSTGVDRALALFGYVALLDAGLVAIAVRQRWTHLLALGAVATAGMQWGWVAQFFAPQKLTLAMAVFLGFAALFAAALAVAERRRCADRWTAAAAVLASAMPLLFACHLMAKPVADWAGNVWRLFGFVFLADLVFLGLAWMRQELRIAHLAAGGVVFGLLAYWSAQFLTPAVLTSALGLVLLFALLHAACPLLLHRWKPTRVPVGWAHLFPAFGLVLVLIPLSRFAETSFLVWPVVLLLDLVALGLAILTASLLSILAVFILTVFATALWVTQLPPSLEEVPGMLVVIGGFAVFFMAAAVVAARKVFAGGSRSDGTAGAAPSGPAPETFAQILSAGAALPFLLLALVILRLPLASPGAVFGVAAALVVLLLGLSRWLAREWLPAVALGAVLLVEHVWHLERLAAGSATASVTWYLGFGTLFLVFPFLFRRRFAQATMPWVVSALALPLHFFLIHRGVLAAMPGLAYPGLIPAALAVPCLLALGAVARPWPPTEGSRLTQAALYGGATLFFITLIFPIQLERQWLTVGWALEGAALLALFQRVPHPGLRAVGVALLVTSFVRLTLNPWVFTAYGRTGTPLWNWYLYAYAIVAACLLAGGRLLAPPRDKVRGFSVPPLLYALGGLLAFALLNIEIADFFSPPGGRLVFRFTAGFSQDMTYSLAWGGFAFGLLAIGVRLRNAATRYAGLGLFVVTVLKLFLHDLWQLGGLYRIGSLVGLALVLLVVSFIYQRFLSSSALQEQTSGEVRKRSE